MSEVTIHVLATRDAVREAIARIPQEALAGGALANGMMARAGLALLGRVKRAYIAKARGGTDEAGGRWVPLKPATIARRRGRGKGGATRSVEILRNTGVLLNSMHVADAGHGGVSVVAGARYTKWHHMGTAKLPQRRLWPEPSKWPDSWWADITDQVSGGIAAIAVELARDAR
jgi:hypothetical protein